MVVFTSRPGYRRPGLDISMQSDQLGQQKDINEEGNGSGMKRRSFLKTAGTFLGLSAIPGGLAFASAKKKIRISDEADIRIFRPKGLSKGVSAINTYIDTGKGFDRAEITLFPDKNIPRNMKNAPTNLTAEQMNSGQGWTLLKCYLNDDMGRYNSLFEPDPRYLANSDGIIAPTKGTALWHYARSLSTLAPKEREADILKATYLAATGSADGAEPILNGTFMSLPEVKSVVEQWSKGTYNPPYSDEGKHLLAYALETLNNGSFPDKDLAALSLMALGSFYEKEKKDDERFNIMFGMTTKSLLADKSNEKIPEYVVFNRDNFTVTDTLRLLG